MRESCNRLKVAATHLAREGDYWSFVSYTVTLSKWSVCGFLSNKRTAWLSCQHQINLQ